MSLEIQFELRKKKTHNKLTLLNSFNKKQFSLQSLLQHLFEQYQKIGIHYYLINKLFQYRTSLELQFYLPDFWQALLFTITLQLSGHHQVFVADREVPPGDHHGKHFLVPSCN